MKKALTTLTALSILFPAAVSAAETDWSQVDAAIGKQAGVVGAIHKYGLPRGDLHVALDGVAIKSGLALGGWIAFEPMGHTTMMMGDLVLTETEVTPVMRALLADGVKVTGVHNHLLRATPATYYMHIDASGDPAKLAGIVRDALASTKTPFGPASPAGEPPKMDFDTAQVDEALGAKGKNNGGIYQFSIPRADHIKAGGMTVAPRHGHGDRHQFPIDRRREGRYRGRLRR